MPLFFVLSGFSLAVTYGATPYPSTAAFPTRAFLQNRAARVLPTYYACLLPCIGLWLLGQGPNCFAWPSFAASLAANVIPVASLLMPFIHIVDPMNAPSWFVMTIGMIWLAVPCLLPWAQRRSDRQLAAAIVACYYLQGAMLCGLYWPLFDALGYVRLGGLGIWVWVWEDVRKNVYVGYSYTHNTQPTTNAGTGTRGSWRRSTRSRVSPSLPWACWRACWCYGTRGAPRARGRGRGMERN